MFEDRLFSQKSSFFRVAMFRHKTYLYEDEYDSHHFPVCGGEMCKLGVNFQWLKREPLSKILHLKY